MGKHLLYADVGPVWPTDYAWNMCRPWPESTAAAAGGEVVAENLPAREVERILRQVEQNFTALTCTVPMEEIEDLPPSMQPHVMGAPWTWVRLFRYLAHAVDYYNRAHMPWTYLDFWRALSTYLYIFFEGINPVTCLLVPFLNHLCPSMYSCCFMMLYMVFFRLASCTHMKEHWHKHVNAFLHTRSLRHKRLEKNHI